MHYTCNKCQHDEYRISLSISSFTVAQYIISLSDAKPRHNTRITKWMRKIEISKIIEPQSKDPRREYIRQQS
jgi:hypothetical protein